MSSVKLEIRNGNMWRICIGGIIFGLLLIIFNGVILGSEKNIGIWTGNREIPALALTFDDGPKPEMAVPLLDILKQMNVKASFFVVGKVANENKDIMKRIIQEGHEIGNHTFFHRSLNIIPEAKIEFEILATNKIISSITGKKVQYFRPPGGRYNKEVVKKLVKYDMKMVMWDVNALDFVHASHFAKIRKIQTTKITDRILKKAKNGSIILMHSGGQATLSALPNIILGLRQRGYQFKTLSELLSTSNKEIDSCNSDYIVGAKNDQ